MVKLSQSLGGFADGADKTAVAVALLGKSGADALPFLKALRVYLEEMEPDERSAERR